MGLGERIEEFLVGLPEPFVYGLRERAALNRLLLELAKQGRLDGEDPRGLKTLIAPLVCSSREQQGEFYRRFEAWSGGGAAATGPWVAAERGRRAVAVLWPFWCSVAVVAGWLAGLGVVGYRWVVAPEERLALHAPVPGTPDVGGKFSFQIRDERGAPVSGADVWMTGRHATSDSDGRAQISQRLGEKNGSFLVAHPDHQSVEKAVALPDFYTASLRARGKVAVADAGALTATGVSESFWARGWLDTVFSPDGVTSATKSASSVIVRVGSSQSTLDFDAVVWNVLFSGDGRHFAVSLVSNQTDLFAAASSVLRIPSSAFPGAFSFDGKFYAASAQDGSVQLVDLDAASVRRFDGMNGTGVAFAPKGDALLAGGLADGVKFIDPKTGRLQRYRPTDQSTATQLAFQPSGGTFAAAGPKGAWVGNGPLAEKPAGAGLLKYSPNSDYLAVAYDDGEVLIYRGRSTLFGVDLKKRITGIDFDRSSRYIALRSEGGPAGVFEIGSGQALTTPPGWPATAIGIGFKTSTDGAADSVRVASADRSLEARLRPLRWLGAIVPAVFIGGFLYWLYRKRARLRQFTLPLDLDTHALKAPKSDTQPFQHPGVRRLALELRGRKPSPAFDLAPVPTVLASVRSGGFFTPVYRARTLQREILLLVKKTGQADQHERLIQSLAKALRDREALIDLYTFDTSPDTVYDPREQRWIGLEELHALHPHHDLQILGDPADFLDPYTLELPEWVRGMSRWVDRAVISPVRASARVRKMLAGEGIAVERFRFSAESTFPASLRHIPLRWLDRVAPPEDEVAELMPDLLRYLGPDGRLLAGVCSIYPETFWPLTLWLAERALADAAKRDAALTRLTLLPWFRHGRLPNWMRAKLVNALSAEERRTGGGSVSEFLRAAELGGPAGERDREMSIARDGRGTEGELRDYVMFSVLLGREVDEDLAVKPPSAWLRFLFEGPRRWLWAFGGAAVMLGVAGWFVGDWGLGFVPARVTISEWKLPAVEPATKQEARRFPLDPMARAIVAVADSLVGQAVAAGDFEKAVVEKAALFAGVKAVPRVTAAAVAGAGYAGGVVESVAGNRAVVFQVRNGRVERFGRDLPAGPFRDYPTEMGDRVEIPPGSFLMGCSPGDGECYEWEKPAHRVTITKGFWMNRTEVTQGQYEGVMKSNPSKFKGADLPVEQVTWDEASKYCDAIGGRLPTEAEWEYAARAGSTGARYGNVDDVAWHAGNSGRKTHPVAKKLPNAWGLYDMLGNVWEWTSDWYDEKYYEVSRARDPQGPSNSKEDYKVLRGGSWDSGTWVARASLRLRIGRSVRNFNFGFRCAGELR